MKRSIKIHSLVFALLALGAGVSQACRVGPPAQRIGVEDQVRQPADVMLAQVIGATPLGGEEVEYSFLVLDQLRGLPRKVFTMLGRTPASADQDTSFDRHQDIAFWASGGGRSTNGADCAIHPGFAVGNSYLVFLGPAPTWRSFEKIEMIDGQPDRDDRWLAYVKAALSGMPARLAAVPDYERVGRFIYGYHRLMTPADRDRQALAAQHAPDDLLMRTVRLADEFERILKDYQHIPDAEIDAALREAGTLHAALDSWRKGAAR